MPSVLPTIPNDPPQGIQALLDKVYLWNPDVSNDLIEKINAMLTKLGDAIGAIRPYNEMVAPINQYEPCYYGDGVYVAKNYLAEHAEEFNEEDWILIARKEITADKIHINFAGQDETLQNAIDTLKTDQGELGDQVSAIESKIPADASETNQLVTKNEVLALPTFSYKVVNELPETGEEKIIYLVPKDGSAPDVHDEYIWIESTQTFELIGTTRVDLTDYAKRVELDNYLPLSGGTLTGDIVFYKDSTFKGRITTSVENGLEIQVGKYSTDRYYLEGNTFWATRSISLGNSGVPWSSGYITTLYNDTLTTKDLTVGTDEGTLNISITAGVATIATNNGLDIVSQTKFDTAPTTDDATAWADVNATALVTKAQVTTALSTAGGGASITIRNWA